LSFDEAADGFDFVHSILNLYAEYISITRIVQIYFLIAKPVFLLAISKNIMRGV
jgi:hypothetical protein